VIGSPAQAVLGRTLALPPQSDELTAGQASMKRTAPTQIRGPGGVLPLHAEDEVTLDLLMLVDGETSGRDLDEVLRQYGRSRSTYFEKLRRYRQEGSEGLLARPPGPRTAWRRPLEVVRFIVTSRMRHPERGATEIADDLARQGHLVSVRSVERTLSQFGLTRPPIRVVPPADRASGEG
jgi:hypothetical protein